MCEEKKMSKRDTGNNRDERLALLIKCAEPLIKHLNDHYHPHVTVMVTTTGVELLEALIGDLNITGFISD